MTGGLMLVHNPYLLVYDPGFQLSFLATMGLILLSPYLLEKCTRIPTMFGIRNFFTATLATQIFVLPLLLYQMGTFSVVAILVNVLVLPMVPVAMLFTFLTGIVGFLSHTIGLGIGYIAYLSLGYIITVAEIFGALPFASFTIQVFPFWITILSYGFLTLTLVLLFKNEGKNEEMKTNAEDLEAVLREYDDWEIVEELEKTPETRSVSGVSNKFPFR
jgi:competence protein ComEC